MLEEEAKEKDKPQEKKAKWGGGNEDLACIHLPNGPPTPSMKLLFALSHMFLSLLTRQKCLECSSVDDHKLMLHKQVWCSRVTTPRCSKLATGGGKTALSRTRKG